MHLRHLLSLSLLTVCAAALSLPAPDVGDALPTVSLCKETREPSLVCKLPAQDGQPAEQAFLPLKHTDVTGSISGMIAEVHVKQQFFNPLKDRLEALYVFPLPDNAAVHGLTITVADRTIVGEIKTTEAARETYQAARAAGQTAAMVAQSRPNVFTASVANIPPGQTVTVEITYFQTLRYDDGRYSFNFPMVVAPRYVGAEPPSANEGTKANANPSKPIAPGGWLNPADKRIGNISLKMTIDAGVPIASIHSPTHEVTVTQTGNTTATVELAHHDEIPNKDFVLEYKVAGDTVQAAMLAHKPAGSKVGWFLLMLVPKADYESDEILPKEMYYIVDHSGSMRGQKMEQAKLALKSSLHALNPEDTFTILPFDSNVTHFSEKPVPFNQQNLDAADKFTAGIFANSGTEILQPMDWVLTQPADPKRVKIVLFLTDGEVSNDRRVVADVQANAGNARIYTFGIGNGVNRWMLRKMAELGHGDFETILPGEDLETKIDRFNDMTSYPVLADVSADYGGLDPKDLYPATMPDLFTAQPIVILGTYTKAGTYTVKVGGKTADGEFSTDLKVTLPDVSDANPGLPVVWARQRIEDLGDQARNSPDPQPLEDQIRDLGLKYSLVTDYTSFVVVEKKQVEKEGKLVTVDEQVPTPADWDMDQIEQTRKREAAPGQGGGGGGGIAARRVMQAQLNQNQAKAGQANGATANAPKPQDAMAMPAVDRATELERAAASSKAVGGQAAAPGAPAGPATPAAAASTAAAPPAPTAPAASAEKAKDNQGLSQLDKIMEADKKADAAPQQPQVASQPAMAQNSIAPAPAGAMTGAMPAASNPAPATPLPPAAAPMQRIQSQKALAQNDGTQAAPARDETDRLAKRVNRLRSERSGADENKGADISGAGAGGEGEFLGDTEVTDDQTAMLEDVLRALAREQDADGLWKDPDHDKTDFPTLERSAIAVLCYHRAGETTRRGSFKSQMERAVNSLIKAEGPDGSYCPTDAGGVRLQAEMALTLLEIYASRNRADYRTAALKAIAALLRDQRADGMFPATQGGEPDKIATAFAILALHRATMLHLGTFPTDSAEKALGAKPDDLLKDLARAAVKTEQPGTPDLDRVTGMAFYLVFGE
ncbi:MAG: VIT domain-containing protein [Planctomycetota bacterium]